MKLRRALATAAATAAIAPLSLMAAGVALADDDPATGTTQSAGTDTAPSGEATTGTGSTSGDNTGGDAEGSGDADTADGDTPATEGSDAANGGGEAGKSGEKPVDAVTTPATTPATGSTKEPSDDPTDCPVDDNGDDLDSALTLGVSGLPGKIVAGSGWHTFKLTAANHSDEPLGTVEWFVLVDNDGLDGGGKTSLSQYTHVQYLDPATKTWTSLADVVGEGISFGETELGAKQTVTIQLRLDITAKAPAGDGFTVGLGGYLDEKRNCVHSSFGFYQFSVLKPGSGNVDPGQATPVDHGKKPKPVGGKKPQGGAAEIPVTGSLAETGSSSMLPTVGLVGGVAVVAGAGAVFAVRRRRSGGTAA
ncbi:LPXTG cell wall anchor domain-containing protein [Streptomyces griseoaurantiacus]|uniref:LPXTG cell wall anchor domain-containing protein n=1 Tax=Streptomyces griseoaurantiacus TaxID=68213 RepID=UPI003F1A2CEF